MFDKFYDMFKGTWNGAGLKLIRNYVCCNEHFMWHRMNCPYVEVEDNAYLISKDGSTLKRVQLSEFLFKKGSFITHDSKLTIKRIIAHTNEQLSLNHEILLSSFTLNLN